MTKQDYLKLALSLGLYNKAAWVISMLAVTREDPEAWKKDPYPGRLVSTPVSFFFVDPSNNNELTPIMDALAGQALFGVREEVVVGPQEMTCIKEPLKTTFGNVLFNAVSIEQSFQGRYPYINGEVNVRKLENDIAKNLYDHPGDQPREQGKYYTDEYVKFRDSLIYLTEFNYLIVNTGDARLITPPPGLAQFKQQLYDKYQATIREPQTLAIIDAELLKFAEKTFADDPHSLDYIINRKKMFDTAYKKLYLTLGAEAGLVESNKLDPVKNSLAEGWDRTNFPAQNNALRAGSYFRGVGTALGGEETQWISRAISNLRVLENDCGSQAGLLFLVEPNNYKRLINHYYFDEQGKTQRIDNEAALEPLKGKYLRMRTAGACHNGKTDYCRFCIGDRLADNPHAIPTEIEAIGSAFLDLSLAAFHGKVLKLSKINLRARMS